MFVQDYERPWKKYQRTFVKMEKEKALGPLLKGPPDEALKKLQQLKKAIEVASTAVDAKKGEIATIEAELSEKARELYQKNNLDLQFLKVKYDVARYQFEDLVHNGVAYGENGDLLPAAVKAKERLDHFGSEVAKKTPVVLELEERTAQGRMKLRKIRSGLVEANRNFIAAKADQTKLIRKLASIGVAVSQVSDAKGNLTFKYKEGLGIETVQYLFENAPLVDFIGPTIKVEQEVVDKLTDDYFFAQVGKVDRCTTCHLGISKSGFEAAEQPYRTHPHLDDNLYLSSLSPHPQKEFGCSVCHEGMAWATDFNRVMHVPNSTSQKNEWNEKFGWEKSFKKGQHYWDHPMIPLEYTESSCLQCHSDPTAIPEAEKLHEGYTTFKEYGCFGCHKAPGFENVRKVGPSLKNVSHKLDEEWMKKWILDPWKSESHHRMPQVFNLTNSAADMKDHDDNNIAAENYTEIQAITAYLRHDSSKDESFTIKPETQAGDAENGKNLLITVGCLACHENKEAETFLNASLEDPDEEVAGKEVRARLQKTLPGLYQKSEFGPSLSGIRTKLRQDDSEARGWLVDWISSPQHYFPNTKMPNLRLSKEQALDIAEFLMTQKDEAFAALPVPAADGAALKKLLVDRLSEKMLRKDAVENYERMAQNEREVMLGEILVRHYGCYGCHEVRGLETTNGIGAELTTWGTKKPDKLDFGLLPLEHNRYAWLEQKLHDPRGFDMTVMGGHGQSDDHGEGGFAHLEYKRLRRVIRKDRLRMPKFPFHNDIEKVKSVVTFVTGLRGKSIHADYQDKLEGDRGAIVRGEQVLQKYNCEGCHQIELPSVAWKFEDGSVDDLHGRFLMRRYDEEIKEINEKDPAMYVFQSWSKKDGLMGRSMPLVSAGKSEDYPIISRFNPGRGGKILPYLNAALVKNPQIGTADNALNYGPPPLHEEGRKVQNKWLFSFLKKPYKIRPALDVVMPTFPLSDDEATRLVAYFAAKARQIIIKDTTTTLIALRGAEWITDDLLKIRLSKVGGANPIEESALQDITRDILVAGEGRLSREDRWQLEEFIEFRYPFERIRELEPDYLASKPDNHLASAANLMSGDLMDDAGKPVFGPDGEPRKGLDCNKCHFIGDVVPAGDILARAPQLVDVRERIQPRYLLRWLINPPNVVPGTKMPPLFEADKYQHILKGSQEEHVETVKDVLFNNEPLRKWKAPLPALPKAAASTGKEQPSS